MSTTESSGNIKWSFKRKAITLFFIIYFLLYMFPQPFAEIPGLDVVFSVYLKPLELAVLWFGKTILGITSLEKISNTGSGDTTFDYVKLLFVFLLSLVITIGILLISKKKNYQRWFNGVWIYARYYLGLFLILYGVIKFFDGQFQSLSVGRLERSYGDSSPMGLLWSFMGYSKAYTFFGGLMEFTAGVLLLFRRTTIAGALMAFGVMANVMLLNFCFDVCVKIFSLHLVLVSLFILSPYLTSIYQFMFQQKAVQIKIEPLLLEKKWQRTSSKVIKGLLLVVSSIAIVFMLIESYGSPNNPTYASSFNGCYTIQSLVKNNDTIPPMTSDTLRWNKIFMQNAEGGFLTMNNNITYYKVNTDTIKKQLVFTSYEDSTKVYQLNYKRMPNKTIQLIGKFEKDTVVILCKHKKVEEYQLNNRGFHWINERAFNR